MAGGMIRSLIAALCLLLSCVVCEDLIRVPIEIDAVFVDFVVSKYRQEPYYQASLFCHNNRLSNTIESNECVSLLAEEMIEKGATFIPSSVADPHILISTLDYDREMGMFCHQFSVLNTTCNTLKREVVSVFNQISTDSLVLPFPIYLPISAKAYKAEIHIGNNVFINFYTTQLLNFQYMSERLCVQYHPRPFDCDVEDITKQLHNIHSTMVDLETNRSLELEFQFKESLSSDTIDLLNSNTSKNEHELHIRPVIVKHQFSLLSSQSSPSSSSSSFECASSPNGCLFYVHEGQDIMSAVSSLCFHYHCNRRMETVRLIGNALQTLKAKQDEQETISLDLLSASFLSSSLSKRRVVVSLSTLPARWPSLGLFLDKFLKSQTLTPDMVYVALPSHSIRHRKSYGNTDELPPHWPSSHKVKILHTRDWGPASKLIPVLEVETSPETVIITIDDDLEYPPRFLEELATVSMKYEDMAVGFTGYVLKRGVAPRHPAGMNYVFSHIVAKGKEFEYVDVLGGVTGIAYKPCFFNLPLLANQINGANFFVDDDWISIHLEKSGIKKIVIGSNSSAASTANSFESDTLLLTSVAGLDSLNSGLRSFRNINFQEKVLKQALDEGLFA